MSGYPGAAYPRQPGPTGYPSGGAPPPGGGYPGSAPPGPGGYPGGARPPAQGGYPGGAPPPGQGGYPGSAPPPGQGGYPGSAPPPGHGGYPGGARPPAQGGYPGSAPPPGQGGYPGARPPSGAPQSGYPGQNYGGGAPPGQGYGGGAPPGQGYGGAPPPGQVDPTVAQWFNAVDQDRSGQIDANELQKALVNGNWSHFSEEACRMMVDMFDRDRSGQINVQEFSSLFAYINQWKSLFESIDRDRSGFIEQAELGQALQQMGYRFTPTFVQNLLAKYDSRTRKLTLDNFIVVCVNIKRLTDSFRARDRDMRGEASMQYEDFIGLAMGAHK